MKLIYIIGGPWPTLVVGFAFLPYHQIHLNYLRQEAAGTSFFSHSCATAHAHVCEPPGEKLLLPNILNFIDIQCIPDIEIKKKTLKTCSF